MSDVPIYPQPAVTTTNRPLVEAWQRGELVLQHCTACEETVFFPREMCPRCWSPALEWRRHSGRGRVVAHSQVYSHVTEPFVKEAPITLAEIVLEDGGAMLARVIADARDAIPGGTAVELVPMPEAARYTLPTFCLVTV